MCDPICKRVCANPNPKPKTPPPSNYLFICVICLVFASVLLLFYALIVAGLSMTRAKLLALIFQAAYQAEFSPSQQQISISSQAS